MLGSATSKEKKKEVSNLGTERNNSKGALERSDKSMEMDAGNKMAYIVALEGRGIRWLIVIII